MLLTMLFMFFFFKQKTAYEMRISDWSSDVCSSDLIRCLDGTLSFRTGQTVRSARTWPAPAARRATCRSSWTKRYAARSWTSRFAASRTAMPATTSRSSSTWSTRKWARRVRVVLDTNILIAALITKGTPPDQLYQAWLRGQVEVVTSVAQLCEIEEDRKSKRLNSSH